MCGVTVVCSTGSIVDWGKSTVDSKKEILSNVNTTIAAKKHISFF